MASCSTAAGRGLPANGKAGDLGDSAASCSGHDSDGGELASTDFSFAFDVSNFSDRVLRIEIVDDSSEGKVDEEGEGRGASGGGENLYGRRKRRREDDDDVFGLVKQEEQILDCRDTRELVLVEDNDENNMEMAKESFSEKKILSNLTGSEANANWSRKCPVLRIRNINISSPILASKSPFFLKLFSNGMKESEQRDVTLRIKASEEDAFMDLLYYMYSNNLSSNTEHTVMDVLMVADKFEVAPCMRYCSQLLGNLEMSLDSALLYLDLRSNVLMAEAVQPLMDAAKQFLASHYNDLTKFYQEILDLPLAGFEAVLANDDFLVASEDAVYDLVLKYVRTHYSDMEERRTVLESRLVPLIRFHFMTCRKLRKVLTCPDFKRESASKVVINALFFKAETPHRQRSLTAAARSSTPNRYLVERSYKYRPVKVIEFEKPQPECVVYLDLKRQECVNLFPVGRVYSQAFHLSGQGFFLSAHCNMGQENMFHCFGLFLGMQEKGSKTCTVEYIFSLRMKPTDEFEAKYHGIYTFTGGKAVGYRNLLSTRWTDFVAADSKYFINGVIHIRAELKILH